MKAELANRSARIGFGGGCHWCTEAVFQALKGVEKVEQGWIAGQDEPKFFSEAVIVYFNQTSIPLAILIEIHLRTHSATSNHFLRTRYRSAVYAFDQSQQQESQSAIEALQNQFDDPLVTQVLRFGAFRMNQPRYQNYYQKNPGRPFCQTYIDPKLELLRARYADYLSVEEFDPATLG